MNPQKQRATMEMMAEQSQLPRTAYTEELMVGTVPALLIAAEGDDPQLDTHDLPQFFNHMLERIDWTRDLHFQTKTTIDTLDYSGEDWNGGSKVVMPCRGQTIRTLATSLTTSITWPASVGEKHMVLPGVLAISMGTFVDYETAKQEIGNLVAHLEQEDLNGYPLIILCNDADFTAKNINNFVWVTFTRSNPSHDIYGTHSSVVHKHWGCKGSLLIDARIKPHHAPVLVEDPKIKQSVKDMIDIW